MKNISLKIIALVLILSLVSACQRVTYEMADVSATSDQPKYDFKIWPNVPGVSKPADAETVR